MLIQDMHRVAESSPQHILTGPVYEELGKYSLSTIEKRFGSWVKALDIAGLSTLGRKRNSTKEELFENLEEVWGKLGKQPSYKDMRVPLSKFSGKPYMIRFGSWRKALEEFVEYVNSDEVAGPPMSPRPCKGT
jgi:hypothetical protein